MTELRLSLTVLLLVISGCGIPEEIDTLSTQAKNLEASLQGALIQIGGVSTDWKEESQAWRTELDNLENAFAANGQKLLGETLRNTADHAISHVSAEARGDIDYLEVKLSENLKALLDKVVSTRKAIEAAALSRDTAAARKAFSDLSDFKVWHDPAIVSFVPNHIDISWVDHDTYRISSERRIEANGWGFDRPENEKLKLDVQVAKADLKNPRSLTTAAIAKTTNYLLQITLDPDASVFEVDDKFILFTCGDGPNNVRQLSIDWGERPPPPDPISTDPPPEVVTELTVVYWTTDDDKDRDDEVSFSITANNVEVAKHSDGRGQVWPDHKGPFPCRYVKFPQVPFIGEVPDWFLGGPSDPAPRTFAVSNPPEPGRGVAGRFNLTKPGTDGWSVRVELYGKTNRGTTLRYDSNWNVHLEDEKQSEAWSFNW